MARPGQRGPPSSVSRKERDYETGDRGDHHHCSQCDGNDEARVHEKLSELHSISPFVSGWPCGSYRVGYAATAVDFVLDGDRVSNRLDAEAQSATSRNFLPHVSRSDW